MNSHLLGSIAALTTACLWTFNAIFFSAAGKRIGAVAVNGYRILMAVVFLSLAHIPLFFFVFNGDPSIRWLWEANSTMWWWVGLSGIVGLAIGDMALFTALVVIGPRRSVLLMALAPIFAAFSAFLLIGEKLPELAIIGITITLTGVVIVILERDEASDEEPLDTRTKTWGIVLGIIGAAGQGTGLTLSKVGMNAGLPEGAEPLNALSATLIRMLIGSVALWIGIILMGRMNEIRAAPSNRKGMKYTAAGAFIGPFLGVTLSLFAAQYTYVGVAQTLMSLMPVLIIPVVYVLYRQRTSFRGIAGACIAVFGVSLLMFL